MSKEQELLSAMLNHIMESEEVKQMYKKAMYDIAVFGEAIIDEEQLDRLVALGVDLTCPFCKVPCNTNWCAYQKEEECKSK